LVVMKFYGRFPRGRAELHEDVVEFVARQLGVEAGPLGFYEWAGRTIKRHRAEIRAHLGFRECTVVDAEKLMDWLAGDYSQKERRFELAKDAVLAELRARSIEPPTPDRVDKIVRSGLHHAEKILAEQIAGRLSTDVRARLLSLVAVADTDGDAGNSIIYFGMGGDIPANRRDEQELSVLCLRVLQAAVAYVNTLMVQDVLAEDLVELTPADRRGLTPLSGPTSLRTARSGSTWPTGSPCAPRPCRIRPAAMMTRSPRAVRDSSNWWKP
jgi:hypothetical protein